MTHCLNPLAPHNLYGHLAYQSTLHHHWQKGPESQHPQSNDFLSAQASGNPHHGYCGYGYPKLSRLDRAMAMPNADELEQFQQLSDHYQPTFPVGAQVQDQEHWLSVTQGPLIGSRKALSELVTEYSQADPTFVAKTKVYSRSLVSSSPLIPSSPWRRPIPRIDRSKVMGNVAGAVSDESSGLSLWVESDLIRCCFWLLRDSLPFQRSRPDHHGGGSSEKP